jgi:hypothetical protein
MAEEDKLVTPRIERIRRAPPLLLVEKRSIRHGSIAAPDHKDAPAHDGLSKNWAGAVVQTGRWRGIVGAWHIPKVTAPAGRSGATSTSWIGIEGNPSAAKEVLQIGVRQSIDGQGAAAYYPWYEWYVESMQGRDAYETPFPGMDIRPGDHIFCSVEYLLDQGQITGRISMKKNNEPEQELLLDRPADAKCAGASIEWVLECPEDETLARFSPLVFTSAVGVTHDERRIDPYTIGATRFNIVKGNKTLTTTTVSSNRVAISYLGDGGAAAGTA